MRKTKTLQKRTAEASAALEELGRLRRLSSGGNGVILHAEEIELDGRVWYRHF